MDSISDFIGGDGPSRPVKTEEAGERAAIYARTSSYNQQFGYSIDEQVRRCKEQADEIGWTVRFVFKDEAETGTDTDRSGFQKLLATAEQGELDVVLFWSLDRLCRSLLDLVKIEKKFDEWEVALHSVTEIIDTTTPVGRFNLRNIASAAELESDLTSQRVQMGMHGLAQDRKWPNATPPLGYDLGEDNRLVVNDEEAELVERIFRMYLDEKSMPQVAYLLNEEGVQTKEGGDWSRQSVRKVLTNEIYVGEYNVAGVEATVEEYRIVEDELFEQATETRYRFQGNSMDKERKTAKTNRILESYKEHRGRGDAE